MRYSTFICGLVAMSAFGAASALSCDLGSTCKFPAATGPITNGSLVYFPLTNVTPITIAAPTQEQKTNARHAVTDGTVQSTVQANGNVQTYFYNCKIVNLNQNIVKITVYSGGTAQFSPQKILAAMSPEGYLVAIEAKIMPTITGTRKTQDSPEIKIDFLPTNSTRIRPEKISVTCDAT